MLDCTSYSFEDEDTLDHDFNIELTDDDSPVESNEDDDVNINGDDDCNRNDDSRDTDYNDECKNGKSSISLLTRIYEKCGTVLRREKSKDSKAEQY